MNPSYQNYFNHYMYLGVEDRKSANPYVGHVMSADWDPYYYEKDSNSAMQPKEMDVENIGAASEEGTFIKFTVGNTLKSPRMMPKLSKMSRMFYLSFQRQLLKKI